MHETSEFLLFNNLFIYQVLCTPIYRRRSLYSFLKDGSALSNNSFMKLIKMMICGSMETIC